MWKERALAAEERFNLYTDLLREIEQDRKSGMKSYTLEELLAHLKSNQ